MYRRPGARYDRGRIATAVAGGAAPTITDILTAVTSVTAQFFLVGDLGYSSSGGTTTWVDQSAQGRNFTIADANAPVQTVYPAINSRSAILGNGTDQYIENAGFNAAVGWWYLFVFLPVSWTLNDALMDAVGAANCQRIYQSASTPRMRQRAGFTGAENAAGTVGSWFRMRAHFTNSTSDDLRIGSTAATGTNTGAAVSTGRRLFAAGGAVSAHANLAIGLAAAWNGAPNAGELTAIDASITSWYGAAVAVG